MIYGLGTDIIQIERVRGVMARTGGRFAQKVLGRANWRSTMPAWPAPRSGAGLPGHPFCRQGGLSKAIGLGMRWPMTSARWSC